MKTMSADRIDRHIYIIRGHRVMLDRDLAKVYGVSTGRLNEQVKRNRRRFPEDFMFRLTKEELADWVSQNATSNPWAKMGLRIPPFAFTEHGAPLAELARKVSGHDEQFKVVFDAIRKLMDPPVKPRRQIGFTPPEKS